MDYAAGDYSMLSRAPSSSFEVATGDNDDLTNGFYGENRSTLTVDTGASTGSSNHKTSSSAQADIDWLSPSLVKLTNRVMTRLAELSTSSESVSASKVTIANKNDTRGLKTTGLLYNNSPVEEGGEPSTSASASGQYYTYEGHDLEGGAATSPRMLTPETITQDEMLMTQQLSGFRFQAETDMVLQSIASSLQSHNSTGTASTITIRQSSSTDNNMSSTSAVARGHSHGSCEAEGGYDTDDDGMQGELAHLTSIAEQLRHDLDGASSLLPSSMRNSVMDAMDDQDVAHMAKHLKSWGLFQASDTMLITAENSMLVMFTFLLAIVWFFTHHGITEFQNFML